MSNITNKFNNQNTNNQNNNNQNTNNQVINDEISNDSAYNNEVPIDDLLFDELPIEPLKYNIYYGCHTDIGGSINHENQDDSLILELGGLYIFGIFDGHGYENGKKVANNAKKFMKEYFENNNFDETISQEYFNNLFESTDNKIKELLKNDITKTRTMDRYCCGGSTCSILVIKNNKCYYAHVGDSYGLICGKSQDKNLYEELGYDHSPTNIEEYNRISTFKKPLLFEYDNTNGPNKQIYRKINDELIINKGIYYKNIKNDFASVVSIPTNSIFPSKTLSMTRALGDFSFKQHGVISTPSVFEFSLESKFETLGSENNILSFVIASDGVWDNWLNEKVSEFVMYDNCIKALNNPEGPQRIAEAFIDRTNVYGKINFSNSSDNAVAIIIYVTLSNHKESNHKESNIINQSKIINEPVLETISEELETSKELETISEELETSKEELETISEEHEFIVPILDPNVEL